MHHGSHGLILNFGVKTLIRPYKFGLTDVFCQFTTNEHNNTYLGSSRTIFSDAGLLVLDEEGTIDSKSTARWSKELAVLKAKLSQASLCTTPSFPPPPAFGSIEKLLVRLVREIVLFQGCWKK